MTLAPLRYRLDRMPMLKALVPLMAGIALAEAYRLPVWFLVATFALSGVLTLVLRSSAWLMLLLWVTGFGVRQFAEPIATVPLQEPMLCEIAVGEFPTTRNGRMSAPAQIVAWCNPTDGVWQEAHDRVMLYADSLVSLQGGERLRCRGSVYPLRGGQPSYRQTMRRRGFVGTLHLFEQNLLERLPESPATLHRRAAVRLGRLGVSGQTGAVVRAMTVADRGGITPELRNDYTRSGMAHLLAVSGLHTGIVFFAANLLLWWLPLLRHGHRIRNLAVVAVVWLYVAVAGFPPSAVRAAVMCSLLQFALAAGTGYPAVNALATAAFGMLLWNPLWIGDVGFRLSFIAVAGILAWGIPLGRWMRSRRRAMNYLTEALCIALAASAATLPLVSHTFGIVPLVGVLASPVVVVLAGVVVGCGVWWLVVPLPFTAPVVGFVAERAAGALNGLAHGLATLPGGAVEYRLGGGAMVAVYGLFLLVTVLAACREPKKNVHLPK